MNATQTTEPALIATARRVVANHQMMRCGKVTLDATTAHVLVTVFDALNETNRAKLAEIATTNPVKAVNIAWKLVSK